MRYCNLDFKSSTFYFIKKNEFASNSCGIFKFCAGSYYVSLMISNLFIQHLGHLPSVNWNNLLASIPTVLAAILTKNLLVIVLVGVFSLAFIQIIF